MYKQQTVLCESETHSSGRVRAARAFVNMKKVISLQGN